MSSSSSVAPTTKFYLHLGENNKIKTLKVKGTEEKVIELVTNGGVTNKEILKDLTFQGSRLHFHSIEVLKKELEDFLFTSDSSDLKKALEDKDSSEKEFQIIFSKGYLRLQTKNKINEQDKTASNETLAQSIIKFVLSFFSSYIPAPSKPKDASSKPKYEKTTIDISGGDTLSKINAIFSSFCSHISKLEKIANLTAAHNIEQLKTVPKANKTATKLLLTALTIGLLAGIIGIGAIMPHLGIAALTNLSISGIPLSIAIPLLGIGAFTFTSYIALKIAAKKSDKAKNYLDALLLLKSNLFLESNLNDLTNSALFILMTLTMIHAPWLATLKGCLAYPTGALLLASGAYQLGESIKSMINNKKIGDTKEMIISTLNVLSSSAVIAMGVLTAIGLINAPITVAVTLIFGALMLTVNAYNLFKSLKQLKEINKVDKNNAEEIFDFLKKNLSLDKAEKGEIKSKIDKMSEKDLLDWITKNLKNFEKEQAEIFKQIKEELEKAKEANKDTIIQEIKKLIVNEEIKNAVESKIERFGSIVNKSTLIDALQVYENYLNNPTKNAENLIKIFEAIKKDTKRKTIAEIIKFAIINIPLLVIPSLQNLSIISTALYNYLMAGVLVTNIGINITPRYRNIPPAMIKKVLDINNALDSEIYAKYKEKFTTMYIDKAKSVAEGLKTA